MWRYKMATYDKLTQSVHVGETRENENQLAVFLNGSLCKIAAWPFDWCNREKQ
jgi:hypothetical protein